MRNIFIIYWIWFTTVILIISNIDTCPVWVSKSLLACTMLSYAFVCVAPLFALIYPHTIKPHKSDPKYLNLCLWSAIIRSIIWCAAFIGITDHILVLSINVFCIAIYALIEKHFKRIENDYFKY